jgi:hypothetical protein
VVRRGDSQAVERLAAAGRVADPSLLLSEEGVAGDLRQVPLTLVRPTLVKSVVAHASSSFKAILPERAVELAT